MPVILALRRRLENQKFKIIVGYVMSSWLALLPEIAHNKCVECGEGVWIYVHVCMCCMLSGHFLCK